MLPKIVFVCLLFCFNSNAATLRLVYPTFFPYTAPPQAQQELAAGNFLVNKIMAELEQTYISDPVPNYKRALSDVRNDRADGFFLASKNAKRDEVAVFSQAIVYNNWSWFFRYDNYLDPYANNFSQQAKVASIHDTNTHFWLTHNGYKVIGKQRDTTKLAQLLFDLERIDAAFVSAEVFKHSAQHTRVQKGEYIEVVQRSAPFGIYIAKHWLKQHPDFMPRLNNAISKVQQRYLDNTYSLSQLKRD